MNLCPPAFEGLGYLTLESKGVSVNPEAPVPLPGPTLSTAEVSCPAAPNLAVPSVSRSHLAPIHGSADITKPNPFWYRNA